MGRHHHGYTWLGHGDTLIRPGDAIRRPTAPDFRTQPVMPLECADWLMKAPELIHGTFEDSESGATWYEQQLDAHRDAFPAHVPAPDRTETVRRLAAGEDVVGGWWVSGGRFLSVNLIACSPHRLRPERVCPRR
ncbi:hypothetical protein [Streptomyces sp. bgisy100]|uniref:hypothetical protein n=1 Tax=Streptomyces sp. bgisy100 TaxID=3413783 RepID=UPI003D717946